MRSKYFGKSPNPIIAYSTRRELHFWVKPNIVLRKYCHFIGCPASNVLNAESGTGSSRISNNPASPLLAAQGRGVQPSRSGRFESNPFLRSHVVESSHPDTYSKITLNSKATNHMAIGSPHQSLCFMHTLKHYLRLCHSVSTDLPCMQDTSRQDSWRSLASNRLV